ncbi:MAG: hypothetical protein WEC73_06080 [Chthoniobacterales bacterium]
MTGADALDTADPDGDGIPNLFERAMFLSPTVADSGLPVTVGDASADGLAVTYRVAKNQSDLTVNLLLSRDLDTWTPLAPGSSDPSHPDYTLHTVTVETSPEAGFLRIEVFR